MTPMNLSAIGEAAAALGNQLSAGIPMDQALSRMPRLQPRYAEFWGRALREVQMGHPISGTLHGEWPQAIVAAVQAGEHSGRVEAVFARVEATIELQLGLRANLLKLVYPIGMGVAGLTVFVGFMTFVMPMLSNAIGASATPSTMFRLAAWFAETIPPNWTVLAGGTIGGVFLLQTWLRSEEARGAILDALLAVPMVRDALRDMYFGLWANYLALMVAAGIPTTRALVLTAPVLPGPLRDSVLLCERDLTANNRTLSAAADTNKFPADDLRFVWWPFYISNAFIVADQTGDLEKELLRTSPSLIKDGVRSFARVVAIANVVAIAISAFLIVSPMAIYYSEVFSAIRSAGR